MRTAMEVFTGNRLPMWCAFKEFDELLEGAFQRPWSLMSEARPENSEIQKTVDVEESDQAYMLSVDLPGIRKEDIRLELNGNVLTVTGERKREIQLRGAGSAERHYAKFHRSFSLPTTVDTDRVEANLENGVLTIALPKHEASKPRSIQIKDGKSGLFLSNAREH